MEKSIHTPEYAVLHGADTTLRQHAVDVLYMEVIVAPTYVGQHNLHEYLANVEELKKFVGQNAL